MNYNYTKSGIDLRRLQDEAIAVDIPVEYINGSGNDFIVHTTSDLTSTEKTTLDGLVANHDGRARQTRSLWDIYQDIHLLTNAQSILIWNDLTLGNPAKLALDEGTNAAAIYNMHFIATAVGSLTATEKNEARQRVMAMYTQDNISYLVHPPFDTNINIPGDEPIT